MVLQSGKFGEMLGLKYLKIGYHYVAHIEEKMKLSYEHSTRTMIIKMFHAASIIIFILLFQYNIA